MPPTQDQIDAAIEQLAQINKQVKDGIDAVNAVRLEMEGAEAGLERIEKEIVEANGTLSEVEVALDAATTARAAKLAELNDLDLKVRAATADLQSASTAINVAKSDAVRVEQDTAEKQKSIVADAQKLVDDLTAQKVDLEKQIAPIADQVARLQSQVTSLNASIVSLEGTISRKSDEVAAMDTKLSDAQSILADLQARADVLIDSNAAKKSEVAALDADIADRVAGITKLEQQKADLEVELKKNSTHNADFLKARADVKALAETNQQRADFLKGKYGEFEEPFN